MLPATPSQLHPRQQQLGRSLQVLPHGRGHAHASTHRQQQGTGQQRCLQPMPLSPSRPSSSRLYAQNFTEQSGPSGLNVDGARPTSPRGWSLMIQALKEAKVKLVASHELTFAQENGHVVIDIRPKEDFDKGHIPGAVNVPFYQSISGWTPWQVVRRIGFAAFGILHGTEVNSDFGKQVSALVEGGKPVILYCSLGGHLDPISIGGASVPKGGGEEEEGQTSRKVQTRSMIAAYQLLQAGHTDMAILKGGFAGWRSSGRDIEGSQS